MAEARGCAPAARPGHRRRRRSHRAGPVPLFLPFPFFFLFFCPVGSVSVEEKGQRPGRPLRPPATAARATAPREPFPFPSMRRSAAPRPLLFSFHLHPVAEREREREERDAEPSSDSEPTRCPSASPRSTTWSSGAPADPKDKPKSKKIKPAPAQEGAKKVGILVALADDDVKQAEGEFNMSQAEKCDGKNMDMSFEEKCAMYPLVGQEVKRLTGEHPALKGSFTELDGKIALSMEKEVNKVAWKELKIQIEMDTKVQAPKARVRKELVSLLALVSKKA